MPSLTPGINVSRIRRAAASLIAVFALGLSFNASASDLRCGSTQQSAERVICDHAILNNEYDDIYAQQQTLMREGKVAPQEVAAWKQKRNACNDVHCIDVAFSQWSAFAKTRVNAAVPSVVTASDALGPAQGVAGASGSAAGSATALRESMPAPAAASSAAELSAQASDVPVAQHGSAQGIALPLPVASGASAVPGPAMVNAASSAQASAPASAPGAAGTGATRGIVGVIGLIVVIVAGVWVARRARNNQGKSSNGGNGGTTS